MLVAFPGLDKPAYPYLYYIDLVYGWEDLFFPYGCYNLSEMSTFQNLVCDEEPLDCGYY